jgi:hypothetical protein
MAALTLHVGLMKNCLRIEEESTLQLKFDLKGSRFQRSTLSTKDLKAKNSFAGIPPSLLKSIMKKNLTLKDNDFLNLRSLYGLSLKGVDPTVFQQLK